MHKLPCWRIRLDILLHKTAGEISCIFRRVRLDILLHKMAGETSPFFALQKTEREGFEPSNQFPDYTLSRRTH